MFGLGTGELLIILLVVMLLFGAKRLPLLGSGLASSIKNFRDGMKSDETPPRDSDKNT